MRKNIIQSGKKSADGRTHIDYDWFTNGIPPNIKLSENVYIDTSYGFSAFHSQIPEAMTLGKGSGCYDRATFITGVNGSLSIGEFNILNGTTFICNKNITVGSHCMFAWGSVITDSWITENDFLPTKRRNILESASLDPNRMIITAFDAVTIEDNVWVGFDAIVMPGVTIGKGSIIGSKSLITENVSPYSVIVGNPAKVIRYLEPSDTEKIKKSMMEDILIKV